MNRASSKSAIRFLGMIALFAFLPRPGFGFALTYDFEEPVSGIYWSSTAREAWIGTNIDTFATESSYFLGPFGNETVSHNGMDVFAGATPYRLSFDLLVFGDWTGDEPGAESLFTVSAYALGLDVISQVSIASLLSESSQSYPDEFGLGSHPAGTGASGHYSLSYPPIGLMSVYHFDLIVPANDVSGDGSCCGDVFLEFTASGTNGTWGLDNFEAVPVPEPSPGLLTAFGLVLIAGRSRKPGTRTAA